MCSSSTYILFQMYCCLFTSLMKFTYMYNVCTHLCTCTCLSNTFTYLMSSVDTCVYHTNSELARGKHILQCSFYTHSIIKYQCNKSATLYSQHGFNETMCRVALFMDFPCCYCHIRVFLTFCTLIRKFKILTQDIGISYMDCNSPTCTCILCNIQYSLHIHTVEASCF